MKWIVRVLSFAVVALLVSLSLLFVASQQEGAASMQGSVVIRRAPADVWPWLTEPEKLKAWVGWLVEVENPGGAFDAKGAKQVWTLEDRNNNNQRMRIESVAQVMDPPKRLEVTVSAAEGFRGATRYELKPHAEGTELSMRSDYEIDQWLAKLLTPLIMNQARAKFSEDLARLKEKAEAAR